MSNDTKVLSLNAREAAIMAAIIKHSEGDPIVSTSRPQRHNSARHILLADAYWDDLERFAYQNRGR